MVFDLQKAGIWKRISAWLFDGIVVSILAVGLACLLSGLLGYDGYTQQLEEAYGRYEAQYGISFDTTQEQFQAMTAQEQQSYTDAYNALIADTDAMYTYNRILNLTLVITTMSILLAIVAAEFLLPLALGNGQTLGKKIFGLCLVRNDCVKMNTMQLFARTVLGKFAIETMIPVYSVLMLLWGSLNIWGTALVLALAIAQVVILLTSKSNALIHDLLAGTAVVDLASQRIFASSEELLECKKKVAAERAARQAY